ENGRNDLMALMAVLPVGPGVGQRLDRSRGGERRRRHRCAGSELVCRDRALRSVPSCDGRGRHGADGGPSGPDGWKGKSGNVLRCGFSSAEASLTTRWVVACHGRLVGEYDLELGKIDLRLRARRRLEANFEGGQCRRSELPQLIGDRGIAAPVAALAQLPPHFAQIRHKRIAHPLTPLATATDRTPHAPTTPLPN